MLEKEKLALSSEIWCNLNKPELELFETDVVVFGIPYDGGITYRDGASQAPLYLRQNTIHSTAYTESLEDFTALKILDVGDFKAKERETIFKEVTEYTKFLVENNIFFTMIGGDHSVTIPVEKGIDLALDEPFGIIHLDAHLDLCDSMNNDFLSHGCVQRRALELNNINSLNNICFIGIRSIESEEYRFIKDKKISIYTSKQCFEDGIEDVAKKVIAQMSLFNKVYITLDIDCLDVAYAPGTGTPQFGGLTSRQLLSFLEKTFSELNIIGFDVVEVAPKLDCSLTSMFAARKLISEMWGHQYKKVRRTL